MSISISVDYSIRRDLPKIMAIEVESFKSPWTQEEMEDFLRKKNMISVSAKREDGSVVGYAIYELHKTHLRFVNLAVDPLSRRCGVGTKIVSTIKNKTMNRKGLTAEVSERNLGAHLFFKSNGFRASQVLHNWYHETNEDAYLFEFRTKSDVESVLRQRIV